MRSTPEPAPRTPFTSTSTLRSIWIFATGTRGDIQPFIAVGAALVQRKKYEVTFFTNRDYVDLASSFGMHGVALRGSNAEIHLVHDPSNPIQSLATMNENSATESAHILRTHLATFGPPDVALVAPMLSVIGWYLSVQYHVPHLDVTPIVASYNRQHMSAGLPTLPFGLHYHLLYRVLVPHFYNSLHRPLIRELDPTLEQVVSVQRFVQFNQKPDRPVLVLLSPKFAQVLYPQPPNSLLKFVGTTVVEANEQLARVVGGRRTNGSVTATAAVTAAVAVAAGCPPVRSGSSTDVDDGSHLNNDDDNDDNNNKFGGSDSTLQQLHDFLHFNPDHRPVYLGWGSMHSSQSPEHWAELCVRAVHHAQQRAIVLRGEAGLSLDLVQRAFATCHDGSELIQYAQNHILFVSSAPHEWLFPQVSVTIHHGGAGTTTAALRAGVPTVITPVLGDQYDHSYLVNNLGVGIGLNQTLDKISWRTLGTAIHRAVHDPILRTNAQQLQIELLSEPNGAQVAATEVETFWNDYCSTGKFHQRFWGKEDDDDGPHKSQHQPLSPRSSSTTTTTSASRPLAAGFMAVVLVASAAAAAVLACSLST